MSDGKESDRSRREKRRGQQAREKGVRRASLERTAHLESKVRDEKGKLDLRMAKLIEQGYSIESVAKRFGVTVKRINGALEAVRRK
jgi:Skp family chaperone for outer membrane proteins